MRTQLSWPVVVVLAAALPSCLFLEDFGELQGGDAVSSASSSGSGDPSASSSVASGAPTSSTGGGASTTSSSSGDGGGGAAGSTGSGGAGGAGGAGPTGPILSPFASDGGIVQGNHDGCDVEITDIVFVDATIVVAGTTTPRAGTPCNTLPPLAADLDLVPNVGESSSWFIKVGSDTDLGDLARVALPAGGPAPVRLAVVDDAIFGAFDEGVDGDTGKRILTIRDLTEGSHDPDHQEFRLLADEIVLTDLFGAEGRVYATGILHGATEYGGDCVGGDEPGSFEHAGFVWSVDGTSCDVGTFGSDTAVWAGIASSPITLAASGGLDFGVNESCEGGGPEGTLRVIDVAAVAPSEMAESCTEAAVLGVGQVPFLTSPLGIAGNADAQLITILSDDGARLRRRQLPSGVLDAERPIAGDVRSILPFAAGEGVLGAVGRVSGALSYGEVDDASIDGEAGFLLSYEGNAAGCLVLDAQPDGGPFDEGFTAAFGRPTGVLVALQWQEGLAEELSLSEPDSHAYDTSALFTFAELGYE